MKSILVAVLVSITITPSLAQPADPQPAPPAPEASALAPAPPAPAEQKPAAAKPDDDEGPHPPVSKRFVSGFRLGWMYVAKINQPMADRDNMSLAQKYGLKSPNMFVLGYEGFYRVTGHSWLNVLMVGNVSIAGLEPIYG